MEKITSTDDEKITYLRELEGNMQTLLANYFEGKTREQLIALEELLLLKIAHASDAYSAKDYPLAILLGKEILTIFPGEARGWQILGMTALAEKKTDLAIQLLQQTLSLCPESAIILCNLGDAFVYKKQHVDAIKIYEKALELSPENPMIMCNLGITYFNINQLGKAQQILSKALSLNSTVPILYINLLGTLGRRGLLQEADVLIKTIFKMAIEGDFINRPEYNDEFFASDSSGLLFMSIALDSLSPEELLERHLQWKKLFCTFPEEKQFSHTNHAKHSKLRIGYLSPDFNDHPVGRFIFNHLRFHDREKVEIYCYHHTFIGDRIFAQMQEFPIHWRSYCGLKDSAIASLIFQDEIDILVDLAGHAGGGKMRALHYKPAPIIIHYMGYAASTGHPEIDYRFADPLVDRPEDQKHFTEKLIYLPDGLWSYYVMEEDFADLHPYTPNNPILFGSFNALHKICNQTVATWAQILKHVPNSRLLLKTQAMNCPETQELWRNKFIELGVEGNRIEMMSSVSRQDHIFLSSKIDIALDPWPYNGTTTTCDLFLANVPVVALRGARHSARVSAGLLERIGLSELIAQTPEEYIKIAVALANDPNRLKQLHQEIRHRFYASPLFNNSIITRQIEEQYELLWEKYVEKEHADSVPIKALLR